jgi:bleomycin hydrolase
MGKDSSSSNTSSSLSSQEKRDRRVKTKDRKGIAKIHKVVKEQKKLMSKLITESESYLVNNFKNRCAPTAEPLDHDTMDQYSELYHSDPVNSATQNSLASVPVSWLAEDRTYIKSLDYAYSNLLDICPRATYQAHSGRCWLFAALNTMRYNLIKEHKLNDHFELSEAYLFFYDKIERCLFFLEKMIELRHRPVHDVVVNGMTTMFTPVTDGGTWGFFTNLISKYGMVPKSCYGETYNTSCTDEMNEVVYEKVSIFAAEIRSSTRSDKYLQQKIREEYMPEVYALIVKFMGEPPQKFDWNYHEKGETFESARERGPYCSVRDLTPQTFFQTYLEPHARIGTKVVLRHDPRATSKYNRTYHVEHFGHMVGGKPDVSLNVPWQVLSDAAAKTILQGQAVWFAADVCKKFNAERDLLAVEGYDYEGVLNTSLEYSKSDGLDTHVSTPSHAMALVGVDLEDGDIAQIKKWKVENSWGEFSGSVDPGYLLMTDTWFRKYGYEVVVDLDVLDDETREAYQKYEFDPINLPFNDAFGAVARKCSTCKKHLPVPQHRKH